MTSRPHHYLLTVHLPLTVAPFGFPCTHSASHSYIRLPSIIYLLPATNVIILLSSSVSHAPGAAISMDPMETAQAIFPSMSRALQKYLRVTRQQHRHTLQSILQHLSTAMKYGLSARSFLEKFLVTSPVLNDDNELKNHIQSWGLVSDVLLSRSIRPGTTFMLRQGDVSLLVTVSSLPFFDLQEEVIDPKSNRFVFRMNSETSV